MPTKINGLFPQRVTEYAYKVQKRFLQLATDDASNDLISNRLRLQNQ